MQKQNIKRKSVRLLSDVISYFAVGSLLFFVIGFSNISNYEEPFLFTVVLMSAGIMLGTLVYFIIVHFFPQVKTFKSNKGVGIIHPLAFLFSAIVLYLGSFINKISVKILKCNDFEITEMVAAGFPSRAYFIYIKNHNGREKLNFGKSFYIGHQVGDSIKICKVRGSLGFDYYVL